MISSGLLGNGSAFKLPHINYTYQEGEGGIADALRLAEHFARGEKIVVMLGDNVTPKPQNPKTPKPLEKL